jgi:hypothetical protein
MTCREFEHKLNELIDAEGEIMAGRQREAATGSALVTTDLEHALLDHAGRCAACQDVATRYQALRRALRAWNSPPVAPADLADRILAANAGGGLTESAALAVVEKRERRRLWPVLLAYTSAMAACLLAAAVLKSFVERDQNNRPTPLISSAGATQELHSGGNSSTVRLADSRVLSDALAGATSATLDLARSASEPAARISRQMLDAATEPGSNPEGIIIPGRAVNVAVTVPAFNSLAPDPSAAGAMLREVGDQLASGVSPLSRTARHAFGFLLGPAPAKLEGRGASPAAKGA